MMTPVEQRVFDVLSRKEKRIVYELMRGGPGNRDIAKELDTTEQVIKNYFRIIYLKTGRGTKTELAIFIAECVNLRRAIEMEVEGNYE
jgi:DNA-binding NarL/FixJ family response regulator